IFIMQLIKLMDMFETHFIWFNILDMRNILKRN
ncbi:MAG: hypothetical protein RLZZ69_3816, partial [Cyanobacteriota bacterium]